MISSLVTLIQRKTNVYQWKNFKVFMWLDNIVSEMSVIVRNNNLRGVNFILHI